MTTWCNAYGAELPGGALNLGGLDPQPVAVQAVCGRPAAHRFRWVCEHGHMGPVVALCETHYLEFTGDTAVPWNLRRDVQVCPRCLAYVSDHRCPVRLVTVS